MTGKLKSDSYSKAVKEVVANEPAILLTGYVDEATKLDLYLNALALLSPSLVEGFGIPVLDAACLGSACSGQLLRCPPRNPRFVRFLQLRVADLHP